MPGLLNLVEAAADRARRVFIDPEVRELIDKVCLECFGGLYGFAVNTSFPYDIFTPPEWWDAAVELDINPDWVPFHDAVCLAERIDSFLVVMEADGPTRPLAHDCRGDLELLGVLADWCQDNDRAASASEARHLLSLVRSHRRGPGPVDRVAAEQEWGPDELASGEME